MLQQALAQAIAVIVESDRPVGDVHMTTRHLAIGDDALGMKAGQGRFAQIDTGQNVAGAMGKEDAVGQGPAAHMILLDAGFEPVHG